MYAFPLLVLFETPQTFIVVSEEPRKCFPSHFTEFIRAFVHDRQASCGRGAPRGRERYRREAYQAGSPLFSLSVPLIPTRELERIQPIVHNALARSSVQRYFLDVAEEQLLKECEQRILQAYRLFQVRLTLPLVSHNSLTYSSRYDLW